MAMENVSYSVHGGPWTRTNDIRRALTKRIKDLDPSDPSSQSEAFHVRFAGPGVTRSEVDSIAAVLGLFRDVNSSPLLPLQHTGGTEDDVLWYRRFLEGLKPDVQEDVWTLQEQSRLPPHGAFLYMVGLAGLDVHDVGETPLPEGVLSKQAEAIEYTPLAAYTGDDEARYRFLVCHGVCDVKLGAGRAGARKDAKQAWDRWARVREYKDDEGRARNLPRFFDGTHTDAYELAMGPLETLLKKGRTFSHLTGAISFSVTGGTWKTTSRDQSHQPADC